jgi:hypothetical protein
MSSAMRGERGTTEHSNGNGAEIVLLVISQTGSGFPGRGLMSKAASESANACQSDISTRLRPAHRLRARARQN